jgi:APA family basic amino acid/polyamine antiporter
MNWHNLQWQTAPTAAAVTRASAVMIFAFLGLESALIPAAKCEIPRAQCRAPCSSPFSLVAVVYLCVQLVAQGLLGAALAGQKTPLAEAAAVAMGPGGPHADPRRIFRLDAGLPRRA